MLTGIHILLTYRCTHECDHCFLHAGPRAVGTFTREFLESVLDQAKAVGTVDTIYFEGGEPFLVHPLLVEGLRLAKDRGFGTGVVTNAYWAETVEDAELWLAPLRDLGVADLSLSDDAFHHAPDRPTPAERAREAATRLGIPVGTICIPPPDQAEGVRFRGRAAETLIEGRPRRPWAGFDECPDEDFRSPGRVHVDPFGNVHACQGILVGNLRETPLADLVRRDDPDADPVRGPLLRGGPAELARHHGIEPEVGYASACHLCYEVRKRLLDRLPDRLGPPGVYGV